MKQRKRKGVKVRERKLIMAKSESKRKKLIVPNSPIENSFLLGCLPIDALYSVLDLTFTYA